MNWKNSAIVGVVHLPPLPGAPGTAGGPDTMRGVVDRAVRDARAWSRGGADALVIENFGDVPFFPGRVPPETVAAMALSAAAIAAEVDLPLGFNVLRNDARTGLGLAAACGGSFIRVNVHTGAMATDQGLLEGRAAETVRVRADLCPEVEILADVFVKHATPLGARDIQVCARDTIQRGLADALIVSGPATGAPVDMGDLRAVREACPQARIFIGSGTTAENAGVLLELADGAIVGTSVKEAGDVRNPVDADAVGRLVEAARKGITRGAGS